MSFADIPLTKKHPKHISSIRSLSMSFSNQSLHRNRNNTPSNSIIVYTPVTNNEADKSIVTCQKCESSYLVTNKSAHEWMCTKCNTIMSIAFPNIYNDIQEGIVSTNTNDSFSPSIEDPIDCVVIERENDTEIEYDLDMSDTEFPDTQSHTGNIKQFSEIQNFLNAQNYKRNISRTVSLCDMDSISTLSGLHTENHKNYTDLQIDIYGKKRHKHYKKMRKRTHLTPNKIGIHKICPTPTPTSNMTPESKSDSEEWIFTKEYEETYYDDITEISDINCNMQIQFDDYSMNELKINNAPSVCSQDSMIVNKAKSPAMRHVKITRSEADISKSKQKHKNKNKNKQKWTPPIQLNVLSEMHTWSEQHPKKRRKNPLSIEKQYKHHSESAVRNRNRNMNRNNVNINEQYGYTLKPSETIPCDISDSAEVEFAEYVDGEYGLHSNSKSAESDINNSNSNSNSNGNSNSNSNSNTNGNSNGNNNGNSNSNENSNGNNTSELYNNNVFDQVKSTKPFIYYSNKYKYDPEIQRALQVAYLTGFNEGYSMLAGFKLTEVPELPEQPSINK